MGRLLTNCSEDYIPMMFTRDDFRIESAQDLLLFLPIGLFLGLVAPFLIAAYTLGFFMDLFGLTDKD